MNPALVIVVVIACLVAIGVGAYFLLKKPDSDSAEVALEVPVIEDPLPAIEDPLPAIEAPLPAMVSVDGWPVVSPSDPIAPVSPEPMAATTWADDLTTMPAEIPVEASTAELDLARADPTAGLFPSTADLKAQDQGAQQVAPVDAPAPAPVLAPVFAPAPAQTEPKAKVCGGTRIWDPTLRVCRERSVKPVAAAAKLDVPPVTIPPAKSKGCGPGKIWDGKVCRPPKGPAPEGGADARKAARKAARDAEKRNRDESQSRRKTSGGSSDGAYNRAIKTQRRLKEKLDKDKKCPPGRYRDAKTKDCRPNRGGLSDERATERSKEMAANNAASPPTTPNAPGQPVAEGSKAWNDTAAYRAARQNEQRAKVEGPAPSPPPGSGGCPPGKSRDPKTKNCRPTAGLEASQKRVADAATRRAVQRKGRYISNSGKGRTTAEINAEVARRGGDWSD